MLIFIQIYRSCNLGYEIFARILKTHVGDTEQCICSKINVHNFFKFQNLKRNDISCIIHCKICLKQSQFRMSYILNGWNLELFCLAVPENKVKSIGENSTKLSLERKSSAFLNFHPNLSDGRCRN